jgi:cell division protein FtsI (penicillin-binding protein 3)
VTAKVDSIWADPRSLTDVAGTADALARILGADVRDLEAKLSSRRHFVWVKRHVSSQQAEAVRALKIKGVEITREPRRFYPGGSLAGPLLGFADIDGKGIEGIERSMNELLVGRRTTVSGIRDASGRISLSEGIEGVQPGATVVLTIHRSIQFLVERTLRKTVEDHNAHSGTAVVLDVATSEVLAAASWPTYDPNHPGNAVRRGARNRAVTDAYEIGSTMKVFTIGAALDLGLVTPDTEFKVAGGRYRVGRKVIHDSYHDKVLTVSGVLKRSSNVGTVKIAQLLGRENLHRALLEYGFGRKTGIELPGERHGLVRPAKRWSDIELATIAFGYSVTATPIQVAAGYAAIGNGGVYNEPRIIKEVHDASGVEYRHKPIGRRIMKSQTAAQLRRMMASVFDKGRHGGTARSVVVEGYHAGGKTGTAHKVDPSTRQYSHELYLSSFAGVAPIEAPRIAVLVVIDEPRAGEHYGARVAGPAFAEITTETLRYLGVPATKPTDDEKKKKAAADKKKAAADKKKAEASDKKKAAHKLSEAEQDAADDLAAAQDHSSPITDAASNGPANDEEVRIPDFRGMSMAAVLERARKARLRVRVQGSGRAISQDPPPGWGPKPAECRIVFGKPKRARPPEESK